MVVRIESTVSNCFSPETLESIKKHALPIPPKVSLNEVETTLRRVIVKCCV